MPAPSNDFKPDLKAIYADKRAPLTVEELRNRLKHIAMLCWGLSIDLSTEMSECERIRKENEKLRAQVVLLGGKLPQAVGGRKITPEKLAAMTPEELESYERKKARNREYMQKVRKAKAKAAYEKKNNANG